MKKRTFQASEYVKPQVELLSFCVERGFELSNGNGNTLEDMYEENAPWW